MNLVKKGEDYDRMQAVRNFKKLGESEHIEHSAKNVKSKPKKSKVKKAKKMKPLEMEYDEPIVEPFEESYNKNMHMTSGEKFTVSAVKGGSQSIGGIIKNEKTTPGKVRSAANNGKNNVNAKRLDKPVSINNHNNEFTIEKTPKSKNTKFTNITGNTDNILNKELLIDYNNDNKDNIRQVEIRNDTKGEGKKNKRSKTKDGKKSKSKTKKKDNSANNITEGNNEENQKKTRKKSKNKVKDNNNSNQNTKNTTAIPNINQIKEFKASMIEPTDLLNTKNVEEDTLSPNKPDLKNADVKIKANHQVVQLGEVRKPDNLGAESLITSSKM